MDQPICGAEEIRAFNARYNVDLLSFADNHSITGYGVCLKRTGIRQSPSSTPVLDDDGLDLRQESSCLPCQPVVICGTNGLWYFIQTENCAGWTLFDSIGLIDRKSFERLVGCEDFYIVTDCSVTLGGTKCFLSARLPAEGEGRVRLPYAGDGHTEWKSFPVCEGLHKGFLPYTRCNLLAQAMRLLHLPYDWGEKNGSVDCSALTVYTYACCGVKLPRNSSAQAAVHGPVSVHTGVTNALPGDIIHQPGHVMLYLGDQMVLHASHSRGKVCVTPYPIPDASGDGISGAS